MPNFLEKQQEKSKLGERKENYPEINFHSIHFHSSSVVYVYVSTHVVIKYANNSKETNIDSTNQKNMLEAQFEIPIKCFISDP